MEKGIKDFWKKKAFSTWWTCLYDRHKYSKGMQKKLYLMKNPLQSGNEGYFSVIATRGKK